MRKGLLAGAALLTLVVTAAITWQRTAPLPGPPTAASSIAVQTPPTVVPPSTQASPHPPGHGRRASFGTEKPSADVRAVAHWAVDSSDHKNMSFVIVDKRNAKVYLFDPKGQLRSSTPALLGSARGDDSAPGIGDKPLSKVLPDEKTTPAGRFVAELGVNTKGEDIVWVDYDAAVSMHRVRANVKAERRLQRLASATAQDNRISFGCINLPVAFYEKVLRPTVQTTGAVVYVLPETRSTVEVFASFYKVDAPVRVAQR